MLDALRGTVVAVDEDSVVLECSGIAFRLRAPAGTLARLRPGAEERLLCALLLRDESFLLFGFRDAAEREAFTLLRSVSGLGPEKALLILSAMPPASLAAAIRGGDARRIQVVRGIGPRLAQRLVVELQDRCDGIAGAGLDGTAAGAELDVVTTLTQLGYSRPAAADAAKAALEAAGAGASLEALVKAALRALQKPASL